MTNATSIVRSPIHTSSDDVTIIPPTAREVPTLLTATSGTSVTASVGSNAIEVPDEYSELMVMVGEVPIATEKVILHVKIDSASPQAVELFSWGRVAIKNVAGKTVAFGAQTTARATNATTNTTFDITVVPHRGASSQVAPSSVTATVSPDRSSPNLWTPLSPHITLRDEYQCIKVTAASTKRDLFVVEWDGGSGIIPTYHVHLPENQAVKFYCRYQNIFLMNITGEDIEVTLPEGGEVVGSRTTWEPDFTASLTINVSTVAEFKTAMNNASDNVDIVMAPGTYDLQAGGTGNRMNNTNYSTAVTKNRRIRSSTGNQDDVLFKVATPASAGMQWDIELSSGKSWVLSDISFDIAGAILTSAATGLLNFYGPVHMCRVKVTGAAAGSSDTSVKWLATSGTGSFSVYAAWCTFSGASKDLTAANGDVTKTYIPTLHQIGNYLDGNGSGSTDQIITNHNKGIQIAWGCSFGNLTTGNRTRVASELEEAPDYLMFCRSYPENYVTVIGIDATGSGTANPSFLHFCDFQAAGVFDAIKSVVCSTLKTSQTGRPMAYTTNSITQGKWIGCDIYGPPTGTDFILDDSDGNVYLFGCRVTHRSPSASNGMLRMYRSAGGPWTVTMEQTMFRVVSGNAPYFLLTASSSSANVLAALKNMIFVTGGAGVWNITNVTSTTSTIVNSFLQKPTNVASAPTGWDGAFGATPWSSLGTNQRSVGAPDIDANDVPVSGGTLEGDGTATTVGSTDIYGRPFLGGTWTPGPVQLTTVVSGQFLYPLVWI